MNPEKVYKTIMLVFSGVMSFFYIGLSLYFLFSPYFSTMDTGLRAIVSIPLFIYGLYRIYVTYTKIKDPNRTFGID